MLKDILYGVSLKDVKGDTSIPIEDIFLDSRDCKPQCLFAAIRGEHSDGHQYLEKAVEQGAVAALVEEFPVEFSSGVTYLLVDNSQLALGLVSSNFYQNPSEKLKLIGVTGTNGKTTIATLLYQFFTLSGYQVGLVSTIRYLVGDRAIEATHTTPDAIKLNALLAQMVDSGCEYCFMEVSSHAVVQNRIAGLKFAGGIFTNLSHDHLDYHGTFKEYIAAKKGFFDQLPISAFALVNVDDRNGRVMLQNCKAKHHTYALRRIADYKARVVESGFTGTQLELEQEELYSLLVGDFNVYNLLAVYGTARLLGVEKMEALRVLSCLKAADGRFDCVQNLERNVVAIIDYAHTPDALENVLGTINSLRTKNEQVITVVGCGGDRDRSKRPKMAKIASQMSDKVILTSDNPRTEDPQGIIDEMRAGVPSESSMNVVVIVNRAEAINTACMLAGKGDIILIAGKGHETYQEIEGVKHPFDDKKVVKKALNINN